MSRYILAIKANWLKQVWETRRVDLNGANEGESFTSKPTALYRPLYKGVNHVRQYVDNCIEQIHQGEISARAGQCGCLDTHQNLGEKWFWRIHFERLQSYNCKS